jgi:hypothetical protein
MHGKSIQAYMEGYIIVSFQQPMMISGVMKVKNLARGGLGRAGSLTNRRKGAQTSSQCEVARQPVRLKF